MAVLVADVGWLLLAVSACGQTCSQGILREEILHRGGDGRMLPQPDGSLGIGPARPDETVAQAEHNAVIGFRSIADK